MKLKFQQRKQMQIQENPNELANRIMAGQALLEASKPPKKQRMTLMAFLKTL